DLDLLLYGDKFYKKDSLEVPHPRMHNRGFVLVPLSQIAARVMHPGMKTSVESLLRRLPAEELMGVRRWETPRPGDTACG
ncbi:MAG: 2-amino-4-hydroxy-6-hydroxymethyldihydropteridine diphosphokinase, partial [Deltaproteobacteria bacterium]|nr:2-amino-4-hydroxy-6-hydroxymethyldihydropteridine diphosphokinase [Deltaproteobacteria bacterium]